MTERLPDAVPKPVKIGDDNLTSRCGATDDTLLLEFAQDPDGGLSRGAREIGEFLTGQRQRRSELAREEAEGMDQAEFHLFSHKINDSLVLPFEPLRHNGHNPHRHTDVPAHKGEEFLPPDPENRRVVHCLGRDEVFFYGQGGRDKRVAPCGDGKGDVLARAGSLIDLDQPIMDKIEEIRRVALFEDEGALREDSSRCLGGEFSDIGGR